MVWCYELYPMGACSSTPVWKDTEVKQKINNQELSVKENYVGKVEKKLKKYDASWQCNH